MRKDRVQNPHGGYHWEYWPETEFDRKLTLVERDLLCTALAKQIESYPDLLRQVATVCCKYREYTNYGALLHFEMSGASPRVTMPSGPYGNATIGPHSPPDDKRENYSLMAFVFLRDGCLDMMECVPVGEDDWTAEECDALFTASRESVWIYP